MEFWHNLTQSGAIWHKSNLAVDLDVVRGRGMIGREKGAAGIVDLDMPSEVATWRGARPGVAMGCMLGCWTFAFRSVAPITEGHAGVNLMVRTWV